MFRSISEISIEQSKKYDLLKVPFIEDEEKLLRGIYDALSLNTSQNKRLVIVVDRIDDGFLTTILEAIDAIKLMGYSNISLETHIYQDVNIEVLENLTSKYNIPIKIKYYLSSSDENIRYRLENDVRIRIDPDLVNLNSYQEKVRNDKSLSKSFKSNNKNLFVGEIVYELVDGENSSLFECALLQYYAKRYNLAINLQGDQKLVNYWIEQITTHSPSITVLNKSKKKSKNKVLAREKKVV